MNNRIYLSPPFLDEKEKQYFIDAFNSNWIAPIGPCIDAFENEMSNYLNIGHACALSSGTAALHLALKILDVGSNDYVVCPSLTFAASANAIIYQNATPVFVDVDPKYWVVDLDDLENSFKEFSPKAFIAVDLYGNSSPYQEIISLCKKYNVALIEDAAEALGSTYNDKKCGTFGKIGILSFNGNKIITTSGGGMLLSNDETFVKKSKFLSSQAREPVLHYEHKEIGYNYRMSNLLAAIGRGQLKKIDRFVRKRREIFNYYYESLSCFEAIQFTSEHPMCRSNRWLTTFTISRKISNVTRDSLIKKLASENIESRPVWKPMHLQPVFKGSKFISKGDRDVSGRVFDNGICLPSGSNLNKDDQSRIIDIIVSSLKY